MSTRVYSNAPQEESCYKGAHYYVRGLNLDLRKIIDTVTTSDLKRPKKLFRPSHVHVYCDRLTCSNGADLALFRGEPDVALSKIWRLRYIHIYTRSFLEDVEFSTLNIIKQSGQLGVRICFEICKPDLKINLNNDIEYSLTLEQELKKLTAQQAPPKDPDLLSSTAITDSQNVNLIALRRDSIGLEIRHGDTTDQKKLLFFQNIPGSTFNCASLPSDFRATAPEYLATLLHKIFEETIKQLPSNARRDGHRVHQKECLSRLRFIYNCSKGSIDLAVLANDAQQLLRRLSLSQWYTRALQADESVADMRLGIPRMTPNRALGYFNTRLDIVKESEKLYDAEMTKVNLREDLQKMLDAITSGLEDVKKTVEDGVNSLKGSITLSSNTIVKAISSQVESVTKLDELYNDWKEAAEDVKKKEADLTKAQKDLDDANVRLQVGFESYKEMIEKRFILDCFMAIGEIALGVGIAVATAGAGGPATAGFVADAVSGVAKGVTKFMKVKAALKEIISIASKMGPKLVASIKHEVGQGGREETFDKGAEHALEEAKKLVLASMPVFSGDVLLPMDFLGLLADWEEFKIDVDMFLAETNKVIGADDIDGLNEFYTCLRKLAIRGETVLQARLKAQDTNTIYQRKVVETATLQARKIKIENMKIDLDAASVTEWSPNARQKVNLLANLSTTLTDHLIESRSQARRAALLLLYDFCVVTMYENCLMDFPKLELSSQMTTKDLQEGVGKIQDVVKVVDIQGDEPGPDVILDTQTSMSNFPDGEDWKIVFASLGKIRFSLSALTREANHHYHLRMKTIQLELEGVKLRSGSKCTLMEYGINIGPFLEDRKGPDLDQFINGGDRRIPDANTQKDLLHYSIDPFYRRNKFDLNTFKTKETEAWSLGDYLRPTLFCEGTFEVDAVDMAELDLSGLSGFRVILSSRSKTAK